MIRRDPWKGTSYLAQTLFFHHIQGQGDRTVSQLADDVNKNRTEKFSKTEVMDACMELVEIGMVEDPYEEWNRRQGNHSAGGKI